MRFRRQVFFIGLLLLTGLIPALAQEDYFGHYFATNTSLNPAQAGDTRFAQFHLSERIQPLTNGELVSNTLVSYNQKLRNHRSGIGISMEQNASQFMENRLRLNYSYTIPIFKKYWLKAGVGVSLTSLNTHAASFRYPDQYDAYGYTGQASAELQLLDGEKAFYPGFSAGFAAYSENAWLSFSADNLNRPGIQIMGDAYRAPLNMQASGGWLFPINKNNRPRRIFAPGGGIKPYSSIGPVAGFQKNGPFHMLSLGVNAFTNPVFWGVNFRYNAVYDQYLSRGTASLNFLAGYRVESWCLGYSYDFIFAQPTTTFRGAHEVSLVYYLYSVKADYKKNKLVPFPNQLMY